MTILTFIYCHKSTI